MARQAADRASTSAREELRMYLEAPLEQVEDIVAWWGVCNISLFGTPLLTAATAALNSIPHTRTCCKGLPCNSGVFSSL
jgi:hypothetical protein